MSAKIDLRWGLNALRRGRVSLQGQFLNSSNYTFLVTIIFQKKRVDAVYKPNRGERPLWDFPAHTLSRRETAAYLVSEALNWSLVPPTICRNAAPLGPGSLQLFIEHNPEYHFFNFSDEERQFLRPTAVFDLLINNADRKGSHILLDANKKIWLIDHGICFHTEDKLRTVLWDFTGEEIPQALLKDIQRFTANLENHTSIYSRLKRLLQLSEINALIRRAHHLMNTKIFPEPDPARRPYPWPPV